MATEVNFTTLQQDLRNYLERGGSYITDPTVYDQIPRLINAAERKLAQMLKILGQIEVLRDQTGLQENVPILALPDRWRKTASLKIGIGEGGTQIKMLFSRSLEYCQTYWPDQSLTGEPEFYAEYNYGNYLIVPTPDAAYPVELVAYMQPVLLDESNQNNFWTKYTPNALLYGALLEASPFLKDDPRIATWKDFWGLEMSTLDSQDLQRILDRASERNAP